MADSPVSRTLAVLRAAGWTADVVQRWIPGASIRKDYLGLFDIICFDDALTIGVQCTTMAHRAEHAKKMRAAPLLARWCRGRWRRAELWSWRKIAGEPEVEAIFPLDGGGLAR